MFNNNESVLFVHGPPEGRKVLVKYDDQEIPAETPFAIRFPTTYDRKLDVKIEFPGIEGTLGTELPRKLDPSFYGNILFDLFSPIGFGMDSYLGSQWQRSGTLNLSGSPPYTFQKAPSDGSLMRFLTLLIAYPVGMIAFTGFKGCNTERCKTNQRNASMATIGAAVLGGYFFIRSERQRRARSEWNSEQMEEMNSIIDIGVKKHF